MATDARTGWLADLKQGDKVIVETPTLGDVHRPILRVHRVDAVRANGSLRVFNLIFNPNGRAQGGSYGSPRLEQYTPETAARAARQVNEAEVRSLIEKISGNFHRATDEQLAALRAAAWEIYLRPGQGGS